MAAWVVIEMNPRVSRSSALASKATGFPIAKIAAKLAVGYTLDELDNDITQSHPGQSFEPSIDYVVTKIPRFAFEKFPGSEPHLTTAMKSVGEVMAIGRTIHESMQKALASLETGLSGFDEIAIPGVSLSHLSPAPSPKDEGGATSTTSAPPRRPGEGSGERSSTQLTKTHPRSSPPQSPKPLPSKPQTASAPSPRRCATASPTTGSTRSPPSIRGSSPASAKSSTSRHRSAATACPSTEPGLAQIENDGLHRCPPRQTHRTGRGASPPRPPSTSVCKAVFKRIDTCAAEFEAQTPYMYSTYEAPAMGDVECEARPSNAKKVVILGGGPNRIGQGIEFDYCCCPRLLRPDRRRL